MSITKDFKTFSKDFAYYDRTAMQDFLEQKALEGWQLHKREFASDWVFKPIEPKKLHYAITYLPQFSNEDSFLLSENKKEYLDFCAEQGWQFACAHKNMVIFFSEEEDPVPFETDPEVELASIHKSMIKRCLPTCIVAFVISVSIILILLLTDISSKVSAIGLAVLLISPLGNVAEFVSYLRWRKKALAAAATGKFSRSDTVDVLVVAVAIALVIAAVAFVSVKSLMNNAWATLLYFSLFGVYFLFLHFIEKLEKRYNNGWKKKIISFVRFLGYIVVLGCVSYILDMF